MAGNEELANRYVSVWNERDPDRRRVAVQALWREDGHHLMGQHDVRGHAALEQRVARSNEVSVVEKGYSFRAPTHIQSVPGVVKFRWDMVCGGTDEVVAAGVGFLNVDAQGLIVRDCLFTEQ